MDPILTEIYRNVVGAIPYVLAAYGLLWLGLFGYITFVLLRLGGLEKQISLLESTMARRDAASKQAVG